MALGTSPSSEVGLSCDFYIMRYVCTNFSFMCMYVCLSVCMFEWYVFMCVKKQLNKENNHTTFKNNLLLLYTRANLSKEESDVGTLLAIFKSYKQGVNVGKLLTGLQKRTG